MLFPNHVLPVSFLLTSTADENDPTLADYCLLITTDDAMLQWAATSQLYLSISSDARSVIYFNLQVAYLSVNATGIYLLVIVSHYNGVIGIPSNKVLPDLSGSTVVWTANLATPMSSSSTLSLMAFGLALSFANRSPAWLTSCLPAIAITLQMLLSDELHFLDVANTSL
ncbi:hypothetical protein ZIOFF_067695 [Zingiber officinale]|uniref:Uncharacterized protein n=1 Tax=Zingiber officinale TaxID=94328 RepID=A0A8J5EUS0_ZINOF|nr:hypothetical protein ZIOFF_067695 [Zingiber officinale]